MLVLSAATIWLISKIGASIILFGATINCSIAWLFSSNKIPVNFKLNGYEFVAFKINLPSLTKSNCSDKASKLKVVVSFKTRLFAEKRSGILTERSALNPVP